MKAITSWRGKLLVDGAAGDFDGHGKLRAASAFPSANSPDNIPTLTTLPPIQVPASARVQTHRYTLGKARLVAFERNVNYTMTEDLRQGGGNEGLEKPITFDAELPSPAHAYELRTGKYLGHLSKLPVALDPWQPALFALTAEKLPEGDVVTRLMQ